jgi:hypothetical protein
VPLRNGRDALTVNWFEIEIINARGETTYRNSFVTDPLVDTDNCKDRLTYETELRFWQYRHKIVTLAARLQLVRDRDHQRSRRDDLPQQLRHRSAG